MPQWASQIRQKVTTCSAMGGAYLLEPAPLCGEQHCLRAIDRAELRVRVVEVRAHRARREAQLERDLLVHLAPGRPAQPPGLARRQRARIDVAALAVAPVRKLVHDRAKLVGVQAERARDLEHARGLDGLTRRVVGEHVRETDESGLAL